ncbi:response regulator transcription factor [Rhabdothermincola sediminis]|uniref:response regulator transcription factor n=1 Tax=Rhabdothermincola sediminis TaxID=2751370 RepID=UPI001AA045F7|nr:response regulator transcription factor [Rhabdothermincola sediminis]
MRVLVLDESPLFRRQLIVALERHPDIEVIGEAAEADTGLGRTAELVPDVAVLTMRLPPMGGRRAAVSLREVAPGIEVLIVVGPDDDPELARLARAGVTGFVPWEAATARCAVAVEELVRGRPVLTPRAAAAVLAEYERLGRHAGSIQDDLSPPVLEGRERQVLERLADGSSLIGASEDLAGGAPTAANLVRNALLRLQRHARAEAILHTAPAPSTGGG